MEPLQGETPYWENVRTIPFSASMSRGFSDLRIHFRTIAGSKKLWSRESLGQKLSESLQGLDPTKIGKDISSEVVT